MYSTRVATGSDANEKLRKPCRIVNYQRIPEPIENMEESLIHMEESLNPLKTPTRCAQVRTK